MTKKSAGWVIVPEIPGPPPPLVFVDERRSRRAVICAGGTASVSSTIRSCGYGDDVIVRTCDLRTLITSLQSILLLAEEHFGEDWGK